MNLDLPPGPPRPWRAWVWRVTRGVLTAVATLGALAALVLWNVLAYTDGHEHDVTPRQIRKMEEALVVYAAKHKGKFPERLEDAAKYMPDGEVPLDAWGNPFLYVTPRTPYVIVSMGADGKPGGEGEDADIRSDAAW
ncbi:MAG: type II secretion system protein GspG [Pseudomonadota bacterium]|nr:type II secretion system protein GspG [Pseudomonadota bacterium]